MKIHSVHFLILLAILGLGIVSFFAAAGNTGLQFLIGVITALGYFLWGLIHHAAIGDLHKKIVVEYILIAAIAVLLLEVALGP
jgi:hypothetical protein